MFVAFKALGFVALAAVAASVVYAAAIAIRYWPGIGV